MKRIAKILVLSILALATLMAGWGGKNHSHFGCVDGGGGQDGETVGGELYLPPVISDNYDPGVVIVKLKPSTSVSSVMARQLFDSIGVKSKRKLFPGAGHELSNIYLVTLNNPYTDVIELSKLLMRNPLVEYAEPDYWMELLYTPADPFYLSSGSWGQAYDDMWGLKLVDPEDAWELSTGAGAVIAVVDTGVDYNHPDLASRIWTNPGEVINGLDDDGNGYIDDLMGWDFAGNNINASDDQDEDPMDYRGHGTAVAAVAGAATDSYGILGLAFDAEIMAVKGFTDCADCIDGSDPPSPPYCLECGAGDCPLGKNSELSLGVMYAADMGADVINMSFENKFAPINQNLLSAVKYAYGKGAVLVAGSGNNGHSIELHNHNPARFPWAITVGGVNEADYQWRNSNSGTSLEVVAPSGGIDVTDANANNNVLSCASGPGRSVSCASTYLVGPDHLRSSGVSLAIPMVSGLAALIKSRHPEFSNEQIRQVIRVSADDIVDPRNDGSSYPGFDVFTGYGRINAFQALCDDDLDPFCDANPVRDQVAHPQEALIISPWNGDVLSGVVDIYGIAKGPEFSDYILEYGEGVYPSGWTTISTSVTPTPDLSPIDGTILGSLDFSALSSGPYTIRLTVNSTLGHSFIDRVTFQVARPLHGFPTSDLNDGKFVHIIGMYRATVPVPYIRFYIGVEGSQPTFDLELYDADGGINFADYCPGPGDRKIFYTLYTDPLKSGVGGTIVSQAVEDPLVPDDIPDQALYTLYSGPNHPDALAPGGNYFYRLEAVMGPDADTPDETVDCSNAFKVLTTGQIGILPGNSIQFMAVDCCGPYEVVGGGALTPPGYCPVVSRPLRTSAWSHGVDTNYDGKFSFYFLANSSAMAFSLVDADADSLCDGCADKEVSGPNYAVPGLANGENYTIAYMVTNPKGEFLRIRKTVNGSPRYLSGNYNWDVSGNYDPPVDLDQETTEAVCATIENESWKYINCLEGYHRWLWFNVLAENNIFIKPPASSFYELTSEPYPFLPVSSARGTGYFLEQPQGAIQSYLPVILGHIDEEGKPEGVSIVVEKETRARQILAGIGPDLLHYPGELRLMLSGLLTAKFNLSAAARLDDPLIGARVIGSDLTVEEIVGQADALIASIIPVSVPGKGKCRVKVIKLTEDQLAEIDQITRLLSAINKALVTYYNPASQPLKIKHPYDINSTLEGDTTPVSPKL